MIFKGNDYTRFIHELWYHVNKENNTTIHINATPVLDDPCWQTLFSIYEGQGNTIDVGISEFGNFQDSKFYLFKYSIMLMLKTKKVISLPDTQELRQLKKQGKNKKVDFYYQLARNIPIDKFEKAINEIEKTPESYSIINLQNTKETFVDRIDYIKEKIYELKVRKKEILQFIETDGAVNISKVIETQKNIEKRYLELSVTNKISKVSDDDNIIESECIHMPIQQMIPRTYFIEETEMANLFNESSRSDSSDQEEKEIFNFISSKIQSSTDNDIEYLKQIQTHVRELKNKGYSPNVIFMPLSVKFKLQENRGLFKNNILEIEDLKLHIIYSWNGFNFNNIIIFDSEGLEITYKSSNKKNRILVEYTGTEAGTNYVVFTSKISFLPKIINPNAFVNIENSEIKPLARK